MAYKNFVEDWLPCIKELVYRISSRQANDTLSRTFSETGGRIDVCIDGPFRIIITIVPPSICDMFDKNITKKE